MSLLLKSEDWNIACLNRYISFGGFGVLHLYLNKTFTDILKTSVAFYLESVTFWYPFTWDISKLQSERMVVWWEQTKYHRQEKINFMKKTWIYFMSVIKINK